MIEIDDLAPIVRERQAAMRQEAQLAHQLRDRVPALVRLPAAPLELKRKLIVALAAVGLLALVFG